MQQRINLLEPNAHKSTRISKILILKIEGSTKNPIYERCVYESVDDKSLSYAMSQKRHKKKKNSGSAGLISSFLFYEC